MKRKGGRKSAKAKEDSNGVEENNADNVDVSDEDWNDEPQDKKKKSKPSKKVESQIEEEVKTPKKKKKAKAESDEETAEEDTETNYEVEKVLDEKIIKKVQHYLIRWKGYEEESDTWEPASTLNCPDLIKEFNDSKKKIKKKKMKTNKSNEEVDWDENEDFEVERILEVHQKRDGKREFLVVWKGYSLKDSSWEPEENMNCQDLIEKFMEKVENAKNFDDKELRANRKHVQRLTYNTPEKNRRLSKRRSGKERVQYYEAE